MKFNTLALFLVVSITLGACSIGGSSVDAKSCELVLPESATSLETHLDTLSVDDEVDVSFKIGAIKTAMFSRSVDGNDQCPEDLNGMGIDPDFEVGGNRYILTYTKASDYTYNLAVDVNGTIYYAE